MRKLLVALTLMGALLGLGAGAVRASQQHPSRPVWSHTVSQGETLWSIARLAAPSEDPRRTVDRLIHTNGLNGAIIRPGQRLILTAN
jgi:LysM repeat protein